MQKKKKKKRNRFFVSDKLAGLNACASSIDPAQKASVTTASSSFWTNCSRCLICDATSL